MNYSNPMQMLMSMGQRQAPNPLQQMMSMGTQQSQPIDKEKLAAAAQKLDKQTLASLVTQARHQGSPEPEIEAGLNFLLKLR